MSLVPKTNGCKKRGFDTIMRYRLGIHIKFSSQIRDVHRAAAKLFIKTLFAKRKIICKNRAIEL